MTVSDRTGEILKPLESARGDDRPALPGCPRNMLEHGWDGR